MRDVFNPRAGAQLTVTFDERTVTPDTVSSLSSLSASAFGAIYTDVSRANKTFTIHAAPRSATVCRNGNHEADTWSLEFDMRVLPFDPEGIAAIAVRIYMWDSEGDDVGKEWAVDGNLMVSGLADEDAIKISPQQTLTMSGRDYTSVLDPEWDVRNPIPFGKPLQQTVQDIADMAAPAGTTARFLVVWNVTDDDGNPVPASSVITFASARSTKEKGAWVKQGKTYWDVIYELVINHGFITFVTQAGDQAQIVISSPRTQTLQSLSQAPRIAYGHNLMTFEASRKLAKNRVPQLRMIYWDALQKQRFEVLYPGAHQSQPLGIGLGLKKNEIETVPAPHYCHDRDSALRFCKMRWEMMARSETEYKMTTRHLRVPGGGDIDREDRLYPPGTVNDVVGAEYNLLALQAGDPIGVAFDPFNQEQVRSLDIGQRENFLEVLGYSPQVAAFVARNIEIIDEFRQPFYTRKAEYHFDQREGMTIEIEAVNFASERRELQFADQPAPGGQNT